MRNAEKGTGVIGQYWVFQVKNYGYAASSSSSLITTKRTKDTKGEWPIFLSCLRDLRVLRGEITYDRIQLELFR